MADSQTGRAARGDSLIRKLCEHGIALDTDIASAGLDCGHAGRDAAGEWIDDEIAGVGCALDDGTDERERQLRWEIGQALLRVLDESRNDPYVVPQLAVGVGPFVGVLVLRVQASDVFASAESFPAKRALDNVPRGRPRCSATPGLCAGRPAWIARVKKPLVNCFYAERLYKPPTALLES